MKDLPPALHNLSRPVLILVGLIFFGTTGYRMIEGWTILDSAYMTLITITTVGFGEVHSLSAEGRLFTIILLFGGVLFYGVVLNTMAQNLLEYKFSDIMKGYRLKKQLNELSGHYIICGGGRMAFSIGEELERAREPFLFIENNQDSIVSEHEDRWPILYKDALLEESLIEARIDRAKGLASVLPTDADNLFVVLSARKLNPGLFIQTRIAMASTRSKMLQAGADKVVSPYTAGGVQIARSFVSPEVADFLSVVTDRASYEFEMKIHTVEKGDSYEDRPLNMTDFRSRGFIVVGVRFPGCAMRFAPAADFVLRAGHQVFLMGPGDGEADILYEHPFEKSPESPKESGQA